MKPRQDDLDRIIHMNGPLYRRIRANCCEFSGLTLNELNRHAAAIVKHLGELPQMTARSV